MEWTEKDFLKLYRQLQEVSARDFHLSYPRHAMLGHVLIRWHEYLWGLGIHTDWYSDLLRVLRRPGLLGVEEPRVTPKCLGSQFDYWISRLRSIEIRERRDKHMGLVCENNVVIIDPSRHKCTLVIPIETAEKILVLGL